MQKTSHASNKPSAHAEQVVYHKTVLDNGVRIVSETLPYVRSISLGVWANVGSRDESPQQNGISHFLEHMVFKGTKNRTVPEIARSLESLGGYLNAFTTKEQTCFYARVLDVHLAEAMDVLSDLVLNGTFKPQELEKEKLVVIEELKNAEDNPEDIIHDYFEKILLPEHSIGFPIIGTQENLHRFNRNDLQSHLTRFYRPDRIVVAAAGNIDHRQLVRLAEKMFKGLQPGNGAPKRTPPRIRTGHPTVAEYKRPINQAHVCIGAMGYGIKHKDRYPLLVLNALLGEGMSSRLYQSIREKHGLAYSVYSYVNMLSDTGVFGAYVGTDKKHVDNAIALMHKEFSKLIDKPISRGELERTKSQIKGTMMLSLENMSSRMMRLGSGEMYFESFTSLDTVIRKIDEVTSDAVQRVANHILHEKDLSRVIIRPS
ncbi:MAG: M16 family metallopeptidase [Bacteroidota bacterium]